mmetsp:Transcript_80439/g.236626  ORF Transcript_80439/g.236626 Transcript_80439/m.236626 type:complete len:293 (-) Transcript_80439:83-961(-)
MPRMQPPLKLSVVSVARSTPSPPSTARKSVRKVRMTAHGTHPVEACPNTNSTVGVESRWRREPMPAAGLVTPSSAPSFSPLAGSATSQNTSIPEATAITPRIAKGTLQPKAGPRNPARVWPSTGPAPASMVMNAATCGRCSGAYRSPTTEYIVGRIPPSAMPARARQAISCSKMAIRELARDALPPTTARPAMSGTRGSTSARRPAMKEVTAPVAKKAMATSPPNLSSRSALLNPSSAATSVMLTGMTCWSAMASACTEAISTRLPWRPQSVSAEELGEDESREELVDEPPS